MKKIAFLIAVLLVLIIGCHESGKLTAHLENIPEGTILNIFDYDKGELLTRVTIHENRFEYLFNFPTPKELLIEEDNPKYPKYTKVIWVENKNIEITGNYDYFVNAKVKGSPSNDIYEIFQSLNQKVYNNLDKLNFSKKYSKDKRVCDSISNKISQLKMQKMNLYLKNLKSYVALSYLKAETTDFNSILDKADVKVLYDSLPYEFKVSLKGKLIKEYLIVPKKPQIGEKYIDVTMSTPDGKSESLSNNLGKFTAIEFWASSCGPCRIEHPELRKLYNKYHKIGFNLISISGDQNLNDWESAVKHDTLSWINISDLKGANNNAFMIYEKRSIPSFVLLDANGTILDDDIKNTGFLKVILEKLFNN